MPREAGEGRRGGRRRLRRRAKTRHQRRCLGSTQVTKRRGDEEGRWRRGGVTGVAQWATSGGESAPETAANINEFKRKRSALFQLERRGKWRRDGFQAPVYTQNTVEKQ